MSGISSQLFMIIVALSCSVQCVPRTVAPESRGYKFAKGLGYYNYHGLTERTTWEDARRLCEEEYPNSHLVILNSEEEAQWIAKMIISFYNRTGYYSWSGFHRVTGNEFVTIFYQPLNETGYDTWGIGEPTGNGDCGEIRWTGTLDDYDCNKVRDFIYELEI